MAFKIFICYARENADALQQLVEKLQPLVESGRLELFWDAKLTGEGGWKAQLKRAIATCDGAIFLLSDDFMLAENFIPEVEVPYLSERARAQGICMLSVLVTPCNWGNHPLNEYLITPYRGISLQNAEDHDAFWEEVVSKVEKCLPKAGGAYRAPRHPSEQRFAMEDQPDPTPFQEQREDGIYKLGPMVDHKTFAEHLHLALLRAKEATTVSPILLLMQESAPHVNSFLEERLAKQATVSMGGAAGYSTFTHLDLSSSLQVAQPKDIEQSLHGQLHGNPSAVTPSPDELYSLINQAGTSKLFHARLTTYDLSTRLTPFTNQAISRTSAWIDGLVQLFKNRSFDRPVVVVIHGWYYPRKRWWEILRHRWAVAQMDHFFSNIRHQCSDAFHLIDPLQQQKRIWLQSDDTDGWVEDTLKPSNLFSMAELAEIKRRLQAYWKGQGSICLQQFQHDVLPMVASCCESSSTPPRSQTP